MFDHACSDRMPQYQAGSVLLAFMFILISGMLYAFLIDVNASLLVNLEEEKRTSIALEKAKQAILGYAVTYPDITNSIEGPGYLLCPDTDGDGDAEGNCSDTSKTTIGRFPYKTLEVEKLRDGSGNELWYVISQSFRYGPNKVIPLNSQTPVGNLTVNSVNDIVALLIAPGQALDSQDRISGPNYVINYLEHENADFDSYFVTNVSDNFNDKVVFITRRELMQAVEKRVLGEVKQDINAYRDKYGTFPWLSNYSDPVISSFKSTVGIWQGHLPFHWSGDVPGESNRNPYLTDYYLSWDSIADVKILQFPETQAWFTLAAPTHSCTKNSQCKNESDPFNGIVPDQILISETLCIWTNKSTFGCPSESFSYTKTYTVQNTAEIYGNKLSSGTGWDWIYTDTSGTWKWEWSYFNTSAGNGWGTYEVSRFLQGKLTRVYLVEIAIDKADVVNIHSSTATSVRARDLVVNGTLSTATISLSLTDYLTDIIQYPDYGITSMKSSTILTSDINTTGNISVTGMRYDIDINADEFPEWFVKNEWYKLIYLAYPQSENSPGTGDCLIEAGCLVLKGAGTPDNYNKGLVIIAGDDLTGQRNNLQTIDTYFEADNAILDNIFEIRSYPDSTFNDQIEVFSQLK